MTPAAQRADLANDQTGIIAFLQANVNARMSPETYRWQYLQAPGEVVFNVARSEGSIVCSQSFLPFPMMCAGKPQVTAKSENSFLAKEHRGTPLFQDVYTRGVADCAAAGMNAVWGYTPAVKVWRERLGFYVEEERMGQAIVPLGMPATKGAGLKARLAAVRTAWRAMRAKAMINACARRIDTQGTSFRGRPLEAGDINALLAELTGPDAMHLDMRAPFLNWRAWQNPNMRYEGHFLYRQDRLAAYAIIGLRVGDSTDTLQVSDMVAANDSDAWLLLDRIVRSPLAQECAWLRYFGNKQHPLCGRVFTLLGSLPGATVRADKGMAFVVKHTGTAVHEEYNAWYMNGLWTEGYSM